MKNWKNILVHSKDNSAAIYASEKIKHVFSGDKGINEFEPSISFWVYRNNKKVASVVFHDYQPSYETIQLSVYSDSFLWAERKTIYDFLSYPFLLLKVNKVFTLTPIENKKAIDVNIKSHFSFDFKSKHMFGKNKDGVCYFLTKDDFIHHYSSFLEKSRIDENG